MIKQHILFLIFISLSFSSTALAQNSINETEITVTFNKKNLKNKKIYKRLARSATFQKAKANFQDRMEEDRFPIFMRIFEQPDQVGIDSNADIYGFMDVKGDFIHRGIVFHLHDAALFEETILALTPKDEPIVINPELDERIKEQLRKEEEARKKRAAEHGIRPLLGTDFKFIVMPKSTLAWSGKFGYLYESADTRTKTRDEIQAMSSKEQGVYYRTIRAELKAAKIDYLQGVPKFKSATSTADVFAEIKEQGINALANNTMFTSKKVSVINFLVQDLLRLSAQDQNLSLNFEDDAMTITQSYKAKQKVSFDEKKLLKETTLKANHLLAASSRTISSLQDWLRLVRDTTSITDWDIRASAYQVVHNFEMRPTPYIDPKKGDTTIYELLTPVQTSFLKYENPKEIFDLLVSKEIVQLQEDGSYKSKDKEVFYDEKILWWSNHKDIKQDTLQNKLFTFAKDLNQDEKRVQTRAIVEAASEAAPSLYTPFYRSLKNYWKAVNQYSRYEDEQYIKELRFEGARKNTTQNSFDLLLLIYEGFIGQIEWDTRR